LVAQQATLLTAAGLTVVLGVLAVGWPSLRYDLFVLAVPLSAGAVLAAFFLGQSLVGEELASGRLAYWFARPISPWSIWGGKLAGGLLVAASLAASILLPAYGSAVDPSLAELPYYGLAVLLGVAGGMLSGIMTR